MPPAARVSDMHTCPMFDGPKPHVGGPILPPCSTNTMIGFLPAARVTDKATCVGPPDIIVKGSMGVMINNLPAARIGDMTAHGGVIVLGCFTVIIGEVGMPQVITPVTPIPPGLPSALTSASQNGAAFCDGAPGV